MIPRCYVSHKSSDRRYRRAIADMGVDTADNAYDATADYDDEHIVEKLRSGALADTAITIFLIGERSAESLGWESQKYIKRELQASMLPSGDGLPNAIIGVVLPAAYSSVYGGRAETVGDTTVVSEFGRAWYDGQCRLVRWDDFSKNPKQYIMEAYAARRGIGAKGDI